MNNWGWRSFVARVGRGRAARNAPAETREAAQPLLDEAMLRQLGRMQIESGGSLTEWLGGEHQGRRKTHALEFEDYRGYTAGDDFRLIDWNVYARLGELFVKTSVAEEAMSIELLIDCSRSMDWGRPTKMRYAEQLADLSAMVAELEVLPVLATTDFTGSIAAFRRVAEPHGAVVVLSDLLAPLDAVGALDLVPSQGRDVFVIHIVDPAEAEPALHSAVELRDRESGVTTIRAVTPTVRRQYMARFRERTEAIEARLAAGNIGYIPASTAVAPIDIIRGGLQRASVVAPV